MASFRNTERSLSHRRSSMSSLLSLLLQVIFIVQLSSSETVILDHHSRHDQSWDWLTTYELASGSGWSRSSQTGEYLVCDLPETATKSTNSWLISNFIDLQDAVSVTVNVEFTARQCDLQSLPYCKQFFNLYFYQIDSRIVNGVQKAMIQSGHFVLAGNVSAQYVWNPGQQRVTNKASVEFSVQRRGLYLGFQDIGGCIALGNVQVSSNYCPGRIYEGVSYNRTSSPPAGNSDKVYGKCLVNSESSHHVDSLYMVCLSNGTWSGPASVATCLCKPGYELTPQGCEECASGTYKGNLSNSECSACPTNTNSNNSRHECQCNSGYYRRPSDNKEGKCTAPPSAPRNVSVIFQDQSVIVVAWLPPSDNGGREDVVFDVNCFECNSSPYCHTKNPCSGKLQFWPMRFNNPYTHVTVTGLQANTSYLLRVTAENGVSYLHGPSAKRNAEIQFGTRISAKMKLDKTYVDDTTAVLTWRTVENPHELSSYDRYEISCFKCTDGGDSVQHQCIKTCGARIRFWPGREGLKDNHVTVSELDPSTLYKFVLYVWKYQTELASTLVKTSAAPAVPNKSNNSPEPQQQLFNVPTIIALVLAGLLFICAVIILLVSLHLKRRWYNTAKKEQTDKAVTKDVAYSAENTRRWCGTAKKEQTDSAGVKDAAYSEENTDNTIIMEEILQEFNLHSIASNGNHAN